MVKFTLLIMVTIISQYFKLMVSSTAGILGKPYNIAVDAINRLFVIDNSNDCISTITLNGQYLCRIGIAGTYTSQLKSP